MRLETLHLSTGGKVERFWREHAAWSQETFGKDQERGPLGALKHLAKEAVEAQTEAAKGISGNEAKLHEEIADCLFLTFDAARRSGMSLNGLVDIAFAKLEKNRKRVWQKPTSGDEPIRARAGDS